MYTKKQVQIIQKNENVIKCSSTSITYAKEFKLLAIQSYFEKGYSPNIIFKKAGFDLNVIGSTKPKECLARWRKKYKERGKEGLANDGRGVLGRKKKLNI